MTAITGQSVNAVLNGIVFLPNLTGVTGSIQYLQDGAGVATVLGVSTSGVTVNGTFKIGNSTLTLANNFTLSGNFATTLTVSNTTNSTLPAGTHTLVGQDTTDTLTNKTLTAPIFTTPVLGTPTSGNLANCSFPTLNQNTTGSSGSCTGSAASCAGNAATVTTNANMTGPITGTGNVTSITSQTGTGSKFVVDTSPTLVTPVLGVATITSLNGVTIPTSFDLIRQRVSSLVTSSATGTTVMPYDNTIPQNTEGDQYMSLAITPKASSSILVISFEATVGVSTIQQLSTALFQDSTVGALAASSQISGSSTQSSTCRLTHIMTAGTTSATTFKIRIGGNGAGTTTFLGSSGSGLFGGVCNGTLSIVEYTA